MKRIREIAAFLALVLVITCMPVSAVAADIAIGDHSACSHQNHTAAQNAEDCTDTAPYYESGNYYAVISTDDGKRWQCFDDEAESTALTILRAMLQRQEEIVVYAALDRSAFDPTKYALHDYLVDTLFDNDFGAQVDAAAAGDYLLSQVRQFMPDDISVAWVDVDRYDDKEAPINFYEITCKFTYCDTLQQEQILKAAAEKWSAEFITASPAIANESDQRKKEYLITKTIYDFLVQNTVYNTDAYESFMTGGATDWYAHSAYAAFFGEAGKGASDLESTGYNWDKKLKNNAYQIRENGQGLSVCEGYAALFYYLCRTNGIGCNTVLGEKTTFIESTGMNQKDVHAWNCVYLQDECSDHYEWFQVDATYAATNSIQYADYVNYYYFLCGSKNVYFTSECDHQTMYGLLQGYSYPEPSVDDYQFAAAGNSLKNYDANGYIAIIRKSNSGQTAINDYVLTKENGDGTYSYYRFCLDAENQVMTDADGNAMIEPLENYSGLDYKGEKGNFFMIIPGYMHGREYISNYETGNNKYAPGIHTITATDGTNTIVRKFYINKINMEGQDSNIILKNLDADNRIAYNISPIHVDVNVVDGFGQAAERNQDYTAFILDKDGNLVQEPVEPGSYTINLDFSNSSRYEGKLVGSRDNKLHFEIAKRHISDVGFDDLTIPYSGQDIRSFMSAITCKSGAYQKEFKAGVDYTITYSASTVHAGSGTYTVTALPGSKYLTGSVTKTYTITPASISRFDGWSASNSVIYTGAQIQPSLSNFINNSGLREGADFYVQSYGVNKNTGTGTVVIAGIGDYSGTATLNFTITKKPITDADVTFKYKNITANAADITLIYNGIALKEGTDYKKSISTKGNVRTLTVTGIGNYNSSYQVQVHVHTYKQTASKAATYFATGYKKYKCTGCSSTKTTKLAQKKPSLSAVKSKKSKQLTISWKKCAGVSGYQIAYSTSSKFTKKTTKTLRVSKASTTSKTIKKLKGKKKYYVRIRVYKKSGNKYTYGAWSSVKSVTTKK